MNVNKKTAMIASGIAGTILALSACGTGSYEYQVSDVVQAEQIDWDCPGEDIAMDAVAFVAKPTKPSKTSKKSDSKKSDDKGDNKKDSKKSSKSAKSGDTKTSDKKSATPKPVKNKGVKLSKKPDKPERIKSGKVPGPKFKFAGDGCETEYEIFVLADDGYLYEQDVRKSDFDNCEQMRVKKKLFPLCTKG